MKRICFIALGVLALGISLAQETQRITVTGRALPAAPDVAGFGDSIDATRLPMTARAIDAAQLRNAGTRSLADLTRLDAGVGDAYNAEGYWSYVSMRGFTLDNRANYRRDGLPINAETALALDNKARVELLKGTSGLQAGTSAPGGLVNLVVKRPERGVRSGLVEWRQGASMLVAVDWGERFGEGERFGVRVNAASERLDPQVRDARGQRRLLALAADARLPGGALVEAEVESSRQQQPSVPGFSLLGDRVPDAGAIDPKTNLNNQPWTLPVVMRGYTGSLRVTQPLAASWRLRAHAMTQRLASDDRIAFPFGCSAEGRFDRYCGDGSVDLYDFRSEGERRRTDALDLALEGQSALGASRHHIALGALVTRHRAELPPQAFNFAGVGRIDGRIAVPAAPLPLFEVASRNERSRELYWRDRIEFERGMLEDLSLWLGLRRTQLERETRQSFTTPWVAATWRLARSVTAYASWGQGVETEVVPALALYTNAARALPALKSRQLETGVKVAQDSIDASLALFSIVRPMTGDTGACDIDASCTRVIDGQARHRGAEGTFAWRHAVWRLQGSAMLLDASRRGAADASLNGLRPTNVPRRSLRFEATRRIGGAAEVLATLAHEGARAVVPDNSVRIGGWTRVDLGARLEQRWTTTRITWRATIENLADRRAWRESPTQFGHAYLFPLAPRSLRLSAQLEL